MVKGDPNFGIDDEKLTKIFVAPTVGTVFQWSPEVFQEFQLINVYNSVGILVENVELRFNKDHWNAGRLPSGVYFLSAENVRGNRFYQKVIVER